MAAAACSEDDFIKLWAECKRSPSAVAARLGIYERTVFARRNAIEARRGIDLSSGPPPSRVSPSSGREHAEVENGVVIVGSDAHYFPGEASTAHRGFVRFVKDLQPKVVVLNGDILDGARISRYPPMGWENRPTVVEELEAVKDRVHEIEMAAGKKCMRVRTQGNHDIRFDARLASMAPEYARVHGVRLQDHIPNWRECWSLWINESVVIKHRARGGIHATHNNVMWAGKTMVTGHLHSLRVSPFSDYQGTRWGVDCGTLAEPYGEQFSYTEDNPVNWRSGFVVLTFHRGKLLWPETASVNDEDHIDFRGKLHKV